MEKKILGVITARGGSKGIPEKNIKPLAGKPLIAYTIDVAKKSQLITDLIVSTEDPKIAEVAKEFGADVPFLRPDELAQDTSRHLEVMRHAIVFMENKQNMVYDYVVILQPTSPFRHVQDIDQTIIKLIEENADSSVSLVEIEENHPIKIKKFIDNKVLTYAIEEVEGTRRQDLPTAYKRSGAVYAMRRDLIMVLNRLYGSHITGHIVPAERSLDIDKPVDWIIAETMHQELTKKGDPSVT